MKETVEIGAVTFFKVNDKGGFGFLKTDTGDIYFQRNHGGKVIAGKEEPELDFRLTQRVPQLGDHIRFTRSNGYRGPYASAWCFLDDWNEAVIEIHKRSTYRLVKQRRKRGKLKSQEIVWEGTYLPELLDQFPHGIAGSVSCGSAWVEYWFEWKRGDEWVPTYEPFEELMKLSRQRHSHRLRA